MAETAKKRRRRVATPLIAKSPSIQEELQSTVAACETATQQLRDDLLLREADIALKLLQPVVERNGHIWLCGNGPGYCLAAELAFRFSKPENRYEAKTRASVLGSNVAIASTSYGKAGLCDAMSAELDTLGRTCDALWCFASDPSSQLLLGAVTYAKKHLQVPVVVFTTYPGTPVVRFADAKIQIKEAEDKDLSGYCVQWAHHFLATVICNQLKRASKNLTRRTK